MRGSLIAGGLVVFGEVCVFLWGMLDVGGWNGDVGMVWGGVASGSSSILAMNRVHSHFPSHSIRSKTEGSQGNSSPCPLRHDPNLLGLQLGVCRPTCFH